MTVLKSALGALIALLLAVPLSAQQVRLSPSQHQELVESLSRGDPSVAIALVGAQCGSALRNAQNKDTTVAARANSAREAHLCARLIAAQSVAETPPERAFQIREVMDVVTEAYRMAKARAESEDKFLGLSWGLGLGVSLGDDENVDEATIVNGVVRVTSDIKEQPRVLFEYHKLFWCNGGRTNGTRGCGPFIAASSNDRKVLSGVAMGAVYGVKTKETDAEGFVLGAGLVLDAKVKDLGDGFSANDPPPSGETAVRFRTRSRWSILIFATRTFSF